MLNGRVARLNDDREQMLIEKKRTRCSAEENEKEGKSTGPSARLSGAALRWRGHRGHPCAREVPEVPFESRRAASPSPTSADHAWAPREERRSEPRSGEEGRIHKCRSRCDRRGARANLGGGFARASRGLIPRGRARPRGGAVRSGEARDEKVEARCRWRLSSPRSKIRRRARMRCWT